MKKVYTGLRAEKIDFGRYDVVTQNSLPAGCIRVVANLTSSGTKPTIEDQKCLSPIDLTQFWNINDGGQNYPLPGE